MRSLVLVRSTYTRNDKFISCWKAVLNLSDPQLPGAVCILENNAITFKHVPISRKKMNKEA